LPALPEHAAADLIVTDPPYGLGRRLSGGKWGAKYSGGLDWDTVAPDLSVWGGNYFALPPSRCWLVWRKPDAVRTMAAVDLAWTSFDLPSRFISHSIAATNSERNGHPTQKPLRVIAWSIAQAPLTPSTILDPYMGSGTTLVAAKEMGYSAVGVELDERWCEVAARRLSQEVLAL
jgi:site-specific DNA-methyltransferase (adenine-specific)